MGEVAIAPITVLPDRFVRGTSSEYRRMGDNCSKGKGINNKMDSFQRGGKNAVGGSEATKVTGGKVKVPRVSSHSKIRKAFSSAVRKR